MTQAEFKVIKRGRQYESAYKVSLWNHKKESVRISIEVDIPWQWSLKEATHKHTRQSSRRIRFDVPVEGSESVTVSYRIMIKR